MPLQRAHLSKPRPVRKIGSLVSQLMSRRGYAQATANDELHQSITAAIGQPLGSSIRVGTLNRGVLRLYASDSVTLQELVFQKRQILRGIQSSMPQTQITDLKFKIQAE